jgi:chemotaxis protein CheX
MITNEDIVTIVQSVLSTTLELESFACERTKETSTMGNVSGCILISGQWQGAVVIQSPEGLAKTVASKFFELNPSELTEDDLRDAFAELTNMIGGNIKGQVPCPSFLSIPSVTTGQDFDFHLSNAVMVRDLDVQCEGEKLRIMMFEEDKTQSTRFAQRN